MAAQTYIKGTTAVEISRSVEAAIRDGRMRSGERLPTVRALAERLGISPATVAAAYKDLRNRGLLSAERRRGTVVTGIPAVGVRTPAVVPAGTRNLAHGNPDPRLLPPLAPALRGIDASHTLYGADLENPELLRLAARDLGDDGIATDHMTLASGGMDAVERVLEAQLRRGDRVIVEDPGFTSVIDLVTTLGLVAVPCPIDDRGLLPDALERALASDVQAVIVTPRAQNPTGAATDEARARELRRLLRAHPGVLILEDDHAATVSGAPLASLCIGSGGAERWAFVRSLSKSLGPDLRLAVIAGDAETIARVEGRLLAGIRWVSHVLQRTAVALWSARTTPALLRKAEKTYAARRTALLDALARRGIEAHGRTGMNVWIPVAEEAAVVGALAEAGWAVTAGERFRIRSTPGIRVTISTLEPKDAEKLADAIATALRPRGVTRTA